jgi:hypothetical protein
MNRAEVCAVFYFVGRGTERNGHTLPRGGAKGSRQLGRG